MAELEKVLKDMVLGSVGAVATVVEKGGELARALVEKGQETVANNQETVDNIRKKVREVCENVRCEDKPEAFMLKKTSGGLQLTCMLEDVTPDMADDIRSLLHRASNENSDGEALLLHLKSTHPGVGVTVDLMSLSDEERSEIRRMLDGVEVQANG